MRAEPHVADQAYLRGAQYKDSANLRARIELHRRFSTNPHGWGRWVFDQLLALPSLAADRPRRILELGAGAGTLWSVNAGRVPSHWRILLSDFSSGMLSDARRPLLRGGRAFDFLLVDAQSIPFADDSFDAVIANHMLYHVPDRPRAVREIHRVLRPDSTLMAATIGNQHLREIDEWLRAFAVDGRYWGVASTQAFSLENGGEQLAAVFNRVEERRYDDSLRVTEVEPVMDYITSMRAGSQLPDADAAALREQLHAQLAAQGALNITKVSGLFLAQATKPKPRPSSARRDRR
ncbi:MAG: class I SAM-dependent methyltransferase [Deltaproteobacteria bacterium]|nr:class I SAM-dependent methyltransferase [Deltaproteobacteria bacterium]